MQGVSLESITHKFSFAMRASCLLGEYYSHMCSTAMFAFCLLGEHYSQIYSFAMHASCLPGEYHSHMCSTAMFVCSLLERVLYTHVHYVHTCINLIFRQCTKRAVTITFIPGYWLVYLSCAIHYSSTGY